MSEYAPRRVWRAIIDRGGGGVKATGETIARGVADGVPKDWITVTRGDVEIDVKAGGIIGRVILGGCWIDEISLEEADDLRALLCLDRTQLRQVIQCTA